VLCAFVFYESANILICMWSINWPTVKEMLDRENENCIIYLTVEHIWSLKQGLWEGGSGGTSVRGCESVNGPQSSLVCLEKVLLEALHWRIQRSRYQPNLIKEISLTQLAGYVVLKLQRFLSVEERIYFIYIKHIFQINVGVFIAFLCY
jgi:hypothetical protein